MAPTVVGKALETDIHEGSHHTVLEEGDADQRGRDAIRHALGQVRIVSKPVFQMGPDACNSRADVVEFGNHLYGPVAALARSISSSSSSSSNPF